MQIEVTHVSEGRNALENEDSAGWKKAGGQTLIAWVVDGSTSVADRNYVSEQGDTSWLTCALTDFFKAVDTSNALGDVLEAASTTVRARYVEAASASLRAIPTYAYPTASVCLVAVREDGDQHWLEVSTLGDCTAYLRRKNGDFIELSQGWDAAEEQMLRHKARKLRSGGATTDSELRHTLLPLLQQRRSRLNEMDEPIVFGLNPACSIAARQTTTQINPGDQCMIMTDGFYRLVDLYRLYDLPGLFEAANRVGLKQLVAELREHENQRITGEQAAVKTSDDATALHLQFHA